MTKKRKLENAGYIERVQGWPARLHNGITVWYMGKIVLTHPNEHPTLYVAARRGVQAVGVSSDEACRALIKAEKE